MTLRSTLGAFLAFLYNSLISYVPLRFIRHWYLKIYLATFGAGNDIQMRSRFLNGRKISLGDRNVINFGCLLDGRRFFITTGNDVSIGPEASILSLGHDPQSPTFDDRGADVVIEDRAWIAYGAIILPGVTIGEGAVVGAGAVVTQDVSPYTIVAGNPARKIGERSKNLSYELNFRSLLT